MWSCNPYQELSIVYLLRALKALGLGNLNSYSNTDSIGVSGSSIVEWVACPFSRGSS